MTSILDIQNNAPKLQYYHVFSSCIHFIGYNIISYIVFIIFAANMKDREL